MRHRKASYHHRYGVRCIALHQTDISKVKNAGKVEVRIDPGSAHTGVAVTREQPNGTRRRTAWHAALDHQGKTVRKRLQCRKQYRADRRYRKCQAGWLPPSIKSRLQNTRT